MARVNDETYRASDTSGGSEHAIRRAYAPGALIALYALVAIITLPIFPHFVSPNEFSRWATTVSLFERGSPEISWSVPIIGTPEDTASVGDSLYSNKPPGASIAGMPGYAVVRAAGRDATSVRVSMTMMRLSASTLPVIVIALLFIRVGRRIGAGTDRLVIALAALLFGTPLFTYGLLYFSHALTASGLFIAVVFGFFAPLEKVRTNGALIGVGLGLAGFSEYTAALFIVMILIALMLRGRWKEVVYAGVAGIPFLAALLWYQWLAFGSPFAIPNAFESHGEFSALAERGVFGIGAPSVSRILRLLFDPTNGLLLFSPVLIVSIYSIPRMVRSLSWRMTWIVILIPIAALLLFSGYPNWHGGWGVGPRYLVPVIPLLAVPLLFAPIRPAENVLLGWSAAAVLVASMTFPFVPNGMVIPWGSLGLSLVREGLLVPNLFHLILPFVAPALPWMVIGTILILLPSGRPGAAAGIILCIIVGTIALRSASPIMRLHRSYIQSVYFEDEKAFEREFGSGFEVPSSLADRATREGRLPPGSWPF